MIKLVLRLTVAPFILLSGFLMLFSSSAVQAIALPPSTGTIYTWLNWATIYDSTNGIYYVDPVPGDATHQYYRQNDPDPNTGAGCTGDVLDIKDWGNPGSGSLTVVSAGKISSTITQAPCTKAAPYNVAISNTQYASAYYGWVDAGSIQALKDELYSFVPPHTRVPLRITIPSNSTFTLDQTSGEFIYKSSDGCNSSIQPDASNTRGKMIYRGKLADTCYESPPQTIVLAYSDKAVLAAGTGTPAGQPAAGASTGTTCDAGSFTWVICPIIYMADAGIKTSQTILGALLHVNPLSTNSSDATYKIWANFRNFADIVFVFVFLIMIFGTALGLDNYTIKKTLPRLVAAAILVQISYFMAGFLVDIGNVLGGGMNALANAAGLGNLPFDFSNGGQTAVGVLGTIGVIGLAGIGIISLTLTAVIGAAIGLLIVLFTLLARQILITLLVVLSPIAMVAWVLPNTEKFFKLWYKNLFQAVMLYPIVMLLFIAGRLFATVTLAGGQSWSPALAVIAYAIPLFLVPAAFKASGTLFNMTSKGIGKVGGMANKQVGVGSNFDKKRAEERQYKNAQRAVDPATNAFGRRIASKRAGFGFNPGVVQQASMAGAVKKGDTARFDQADRALENMTTTQLEETAMASGSSDLTKRAAVARLAAKSETGALTRILEKGTVGGSDASNPEWQKAIGSKAGDLVKTAPHLVMSTANSATAYSGMGAEQVAGLATSGFDQWKKNTTTDRQKDVARTIASSPQLSNRITETRREELNSATTASLASGDAHYIPTASEASSVTRYNNLVDEAYDTNKAVTDIGAIVSDPSRSSSLPAGVRPGQVVQHAATNDLYRESVEHAVRTGGAIPAPPPPKPSAPMVDPLTQGEVKIPGDDRSVS